MRRILPKARKRTRPTTPAPLTKTLNPRDCDPPQQQTQDRRQLQPLAGRRRSSAPRGLFSGRHESSALREQLLGDIGQLQSGDEAADWVHKNLAAKNALIDADADLVEAGFREKLYPNLLGMRKALAKRVEFDSFEGMIRPGFLLGDERSALIALARDGSVTHRLARRANALVLLDDGLSCEQVARVLLLDDDTIRRWHGAFAEGGRKALMRFEAGGSACVLSEAQRGKLVGWVRAASPRSTGQIGVWIASEFGVEYESRSGLVALLHRLGLEYRKPEVIPRHLDETKQRAFIKLYEKLMNALGADEAVLFVDAVHPTHGARAAGCWAAKDEHLAIEQTTGRQRLNIHGAIDLETGRTKMIEAEAIDAASTIKLLAGIEALYSTTALIHVFLDNARYHHAKIVRKWLSQPGRRIALHFVPSYCPHLNPIERLWALMHQHLTHNKTYPTCREFADAILNFLRDEVPRKWGEFCDSVTDNFRVVLPANFRILA